MTTTLVAASGDTTARAAAIAAELAPAWPIERFVAVNPLAGLEHLSFSDAVERVSRTVGAPGWRPEPAMRAAELGGRIADTDLRAALRAHVGTTAESDVELMPDRLASVEFVLLADLRHAPPAPPARRAALTPAEAWDAHHGTRLADTADGLMSGWLAAYLDEGQARWALPGRERGLYGAWRALAPHDPAFSRAARREITSLPADTAGALDALLDEAGGEPDVLLRALLTRQPGWTAHARWRAEQAEDLTAAELATVRLACERSLLLAVAGSRPLARIPDVLPLPGPDPQARVTAVAAALDVAPSAALEATLTLVQPEDRAAIWQDALERGYRRQLLGTISTTARTPGGARRPEAAAQAVFCIDVRSEPLRRMLEATGPYETLGFAGFFGLAVEARALGGDVTTEQCPVLVSPAATVEEVATPGAEGAAERRVLRSDRRAAARDAFAGAKKGLAAKYVFAEAVGFLMGPVATARTLAPDRAADLADRLGSDPAPATRVDVTALPVEDRAAAARNALTAMGLVSGFAPIVLLCGHGSTTTNNPHQAALDCGACGGHRGGVNARAMATVLNDPVIRARLHTDGITIPPETWFAAAEHDTATDTVTLLDRDVPTSHADAVARLKQDLALAGASTAAERARRLPGARHSRGAVREVRRRSRDWAQVAPEWGLAGCAALVVGSRELTAGLDLGGRVFLHSYDATADPDGTALGVILTAPLVVAHWIASQYYFSSVAPDQFGAGTKISHNVVGAIGVLSGPGGDLRGGLPWESVGAGPALVHEPQRLLAIVDAPTDRIDTILDEAPEVHALVDGHWLTLVARDGADAPWQRRTPGGRWVIEEARA